jgi:hypothetical protein
MRSATKNKVGKDRDYLEWLHLQPCIVTGRLNVTVHHVKECPGGPRVDRRGVPLVHELHMLTHEVSGQPCVERGRERFEEFWQVDIEWEIKRLNMVYEAKAAALILAEKGQ